MPQICFYNEKPGLNKVRFNALLRERLGMSLSEAKAIVDSILANERVFVTIPNVDDVTNLLAQAQALGAVGELRKETMTTTSTRS